MRREIIPRKIIIDTDPGQDDAVAILLALASPELDVRAVIAVAGNVPLALTSVNARRVLELAGRTDVPFYEGAARPLMGPLAGPLGGAPVTAEHVHGRTGLDGMTFDAPPSMPAPERSGVTFLIETLRAAEQGDYTFVSLGPLTDLAVALTLAPDIARGLERIVLMGGAWSELGNITPAAEFNIYADPAAARIVFSSGVPITVLPLDVTHRCRTTPARLAAFRASGNRCSLAAADMLSFSERFDRAKYGWAGAPLHDPCTIAWLLQPEIFGGRSVNVRIETESPLSRGMTVVDWWKVTDRQANALFLRDVDDTAFYDLLTARLARLP